MREVFLGEYIRQKRLDAGLTQAQLCEGICEPVTISRLENGQQTPGRTTIKAILERLGLPDDRYFALLSDRELEIASLQKEITGASVCYIREQRPELRGYVLKKLEELERITDPKDRLTRQFILWHRSDMGTYERLYSYEEQLDMLMEAIRMTVPRFDVDAISLGLYSSTEIQLINQIAVIYSKSGQRKKAADIYRQLLQYIEKHHKNLDAYGKDFSLIAHNYAIQLGLEKHFDESIKLANRGWKACIKYGDYQFLPGFLAILAECYFFLGDKERSKNFYIQAYSIYQAIEDQRNLKIMRREMDERLGLHMPF